MKEQGTKMSLFQVFLILIPFSLLLFTGCKKEKVDFGFDHTVATYEQSGVQLFNLPSYSGLAIGSDTLTGHGATIYLPNNGLIGEKWRVPKTLLNNSATEITVWNPTSQDTVRFTVGSASEESDYYLIRKIGTGQPDVVNVQRDNTPSAKADHFKIRLLNLMKQMPELTTAANTGSIEDLYGPITLTYADGTPVSAKTTNITIDQIASEYVEVPYGTYQFRVMTVDGRLVSAVSLDPQLNGNNGVLMDPATSRMHIPTTASEVSGNTYSPVYTFQSGGIYSIIVTPFTFSYYTRNSILYPTEGYQNQFKIVADIAIPTNTKYGKIQAVNVFPGMTVSFRLNGSTLAEDVAYGEATDYRSLPVGNYTLEVLDQDQEIIIKTEYQLAAGQNHTQWLWSTSDNYPRLTPVQNDLSSEYYSSVAEDDATGNRIGNTMTTAVRFLNLNPDEPYISFTVDNGEDMREYEQGYLMVGGTAEHSDEATYNLQPGIVPAHFPYTRWQINYGIHFRLLTYRSKPEVAPGNWASDIPAVNSYFFVADPDMYIRLNREVPTMEAGIYTVALIGRTGEDIPTARKGRLLFVKHSK